MDAVLVATLVWQVIDFLRELVNWRTQLSAVVTQATAWIGGIIIVLIAAHAQVTKVLVFPGLPVALGKLDFWSAVLVGLVISSLASSLVDIKQSIDNNDSSAKPPLIKAGPVVVVAPPDPATPAAPARARRHAGES